VHPRFDLELPAPERWTLERVQGQPFLMGPQVGSFRDNFALVAFDVPPETAIDVLLAGQKATIEAQEDLELEAAETRTLGGREVGYLRYRGTSGKNELVHSVVLCLVDGRALAITATVAAANWEWMQRVVEASFGGLRFDRTRRRDGDR
jgi:hypothetical protein